MDTKPYKLRLKKGELQGGRRRVVRLLAGPVSFHADQTNLGAPDYPEKVVRMTVEEVAQFKANSDFEIHEASASEADAHLGARKKLSKPTKAPEPKGGVVSPPPGN
jgi:hypothetical protein